MRGGLVTPKIPARVIHTSIRVPVTAEEYAAIKRAAKLRGAPSLAAWLRERGACFGLADGLEGLATAEDCKDAIRAMRAAEQERDEWMRVAASWPAWGACLGRAYSRLVDAQKARADAAEAKLAAIDAPWNGGALHHIEMLHADQRASRDREEALALKLDAAETKLAALVEAADFLGPTWPSELVAWMGRGGKPDEATRAAVAGLQDLHAALRAARGPS